MHFYKSKDKQSSIARRLKLIARIICYDSFRHIRLCAKAKNGEMPALHLRTGGKVQY